MRCGAATACAAGIFGAVAVAVAGQSRGGEAVFSQRATRRPRSWQELAAEASRGQIG
jgi:hypothetical protein